jgi:hypothetical protein
MFQKLVLFPTSGEGNGGDSYSVGLLERASGPKTASPSPPHLRTKTVIVGETMDEVREPSIPSVIRHRQNPLESSFVT